MCNMNSVRIKIGTIVLSLSLVFSVFALIGCAERDKFQTVDTVSIYGTNQGANFYTVFRVQNNSQSGGIIGPETGTLLVSVTDKHIVVKFDTEDKSFSNKIYTFYTHSISKYYITYLE